MAVADFINKLMRPFSMYKGMSLGLTGVWAAALALSFFGGIAFSPLALVVSMVLLVAVTIITSILCGKLFGIKAHIESSYITGLILALIFTPTLDVAGLVVLAFVAMIAAASKFILVFKGRHVFNPAALAAAVVALVGLGSASWWVATPALTVLVIGVGILSLYRTKHFMVAGLFLAITIPALLIQLLGFGMTLPESAWALLSWPLFFAAGVMLTEPLTLPPKRWQMYVVATVVAILFVVPLKFGSIEVSPALALVIGNIIAAVFASRRAVQLTLKSRKPLTPTTDEFVFSASTPLNYEPGQFVEIGLPSGKSDSRGVRRSFSVTSHPGQKDISLGIKFYEPSSSFKKQLRALPIGSQIQVVNYGGDFVLPKNKKMPLLYVAGGIGVTPFISHVTALKAAKEARDIVLVYAVNSPSELAYAKRLEDAGIKVVIVSPDKPKDLPKSWRYLKGSRLTKELLETAAGDIPTRVAYVSGPTPFVQSVKKSLRQLKAFKVKTDYFTGY